MEKKWCNFCGFFPHRNGRRCRCEFGVAAVTQKKVCILVTLPPPPFARSSSELSFFSSFVDFVSPEKRGVKNWGLISEKRYNAFSSFFWEGGFDFSSSGAGLMHKEKSVDGSLTLVLG